MINTIVYFPTAYIESNRPQSIQRELELELYFEFRVCKLCILIPGPFLPRDARSASAVGR